jgi:hypothetical protein
MRPCGRLTTHHCLECDRVDSELRGRTWQDVASNFPAYCHDAFPLLTPAARLYFLPAYMLAAIGPDANCQGISLESALQDEWPPPRLFNASQREAIAAWIVEYWQETSGEAPPKELLGRWTQL